MATTNRTAERADIWPNLRHHAIQRLRKATADQVAVAVHLIAMLLEVSQNDQAWQAAADHRDRSTGRLDPR